MYISVCVCMTDSIQFKNMLVKLGIMSSMFGAKKSTKRSNFSPPKNQIKYVDIPPTQNASHQQDDITFVVGNPKLRRDSSKKKTNTPWTKIHSKQLPPAPPPPSETFRE